MAITKKPTRKKTTRKKVASLATCSGSGVALRKSTSKSVRKAASKKLNTTCKAKAKKRKTAKKK